METISVQQIESGSSLEPVFKIYSDNGITPYVLDDLLNVIVWFVDSRTNSILGKYSMTGLPLHNTDDFVVINSNLGTFKINIQNTVTELWGESLVRFEISIQKEKTGFTPEFEMIVKENIFSVKNNKIKAI
jgi:hypothetical protein